MKIRLVLTSILFASVSEAATIVEHEWRGEYGSYASALFTHEGGEVNFFSEGAYNFADHFISATETGLKYFLYDGVDTHSVSNGEEYSKYNPFGWGYFHRDFYYFALGFDGNMVRTLEITIEPQCYTVSLFTNKPCPDSNSLAHSYFFTTRENLGTERGTWTPKLPYIAPVPLPEAVSFLTLGLLAFLPIRKLRRKK